MTQKAILDYLSFVSDIKNQNSNGQFLSQEEMLFKNGAFFNSTKRLKINFRGNKRECFKNAIECAIDNDLIYCEGFCQSSVIVTLHAFCVDIHGNVYDPTWDNQEKMTYHGIKFNTKKVFRYMIRSGIYLSMIDDYHHGWPLLTGKRKLQNWTHTKD